VRRLLRAATVAVPTTLVLLVVAAGAALAHGEAPLPGTPLLEVALAWTFEPHIVLPLLVAWWLYRRAFGQVAREHPGNPMPRWRAWAWNGGLLTLFVALASPIGVYDTTLFSVHMVQHMLLMLIAPPLLAMGAPITLLLRVSTPRVRQRLILPALHSWPVKLISFPIVTWVTFAAVGFGTHFSPIYDAALTDDFVHLLEHALFLGSGLLFWWPVVGADPSPWRLPHPARILYVVLALPWNSFLGLAIFSAPQVLYPTYVPLALAYGSDALTDQALGGGIMWIMGDGVFLLAVVIAVWVWLRAEEREGDRVDALLDRQAAARR
jgi:putative membrane protein